MLQDNTDNNVQDLRNQVEAARQKAAASNGEYDADSRPNTCRCNTLGNSPRGPKPYGPSGQQQGAESQQQLTPAAQEELQLAAKDRELAYDSRFASNLAYAHSARYSVAATAVAFGRRVRVQLARNRM